MAGDVELQAQPTGFVGDVTFDTGFFSAVSDDFGTIHEVLQTQGVLVVAFDKRKEASPELGQAIRPVECFAEGNTWKDRRQLRNRPVITSVAEVVRLQSKPTRVRRGQILKLSGNLQRV